MLDEVEIIPVLHKVTGAGHGCKGGGGGPGGVDIYTICTKLINECHAV